MNKHQEKPKRRSIKEWFGFNKDEYRVNEITADFVGFNKDLSKDLLRRAERALISGRGLKLVLLHKRGDGKTHMANYVANVLSERGLVKKIYLINPAMSRGSRYLELHKIIMRAFRDNKIIPNIFERAFSSSKNVTELFSSKNLLSAYQAYEAKNVTEAELFRYMSGEKLSSSLLEKLNATNELDSSDALRLLRSIADLYWNIEGKMLMLIIDEVDNLKDVTLGARDFKEAFRQMSEISKLSIFFIFNVATEDKLSIDVLPSPLKDTGVVTRIGSRNYMIAPEAMRIAELQTFVIEVNKRLRGNHFKKALNRAIKDCGEKEINENLFPFTKSGFEAFEKMVQKFLSESEKGKALLPRSVLVYINDCCAEAALQGKAAIDENVVETVGNFTQ